MCISTLVIWLLESKVLEVEVTTSKNHNSTLAGVSALLDEATLAQNNHLLQEYILHSSFYTFSPTSDPTRMVKSTDTGVPAGTGGADYVSFPSGRMENGGNVTNSYKVTSPPGHTMVGTKRHTRKKNPYICRCALSVGS